MSGVRRRQVVVSPGMGPVEALWQDFICYRGPLLATLLGDNAQAHTREMKVAFYAGVRALVLSMMGTLSEGSEITDSDADLMSAIAADLDSFLPIEPRLSDVANAVGDTGGVH